MTRKQWAAELAFYDRLRVIGFDADEARDLRRIERTLHRWAEHESNGNIERDGPDADGVPYWSIPELGQHRAYRIPDRERGALRRLAALMARHPGWLAYHQGDPRGCALYLVSEGELAHGPLDAVYSRGVAVCV